MMARDQGSFRIDNPWPKIGWGMVAGILVIAAALGFAVLARYQQNDSNLDLWNAICRGLGITSDNGPEREVQPALHTTTRIAWSSSTLDETPAAGMRMGSRVRHSKFGDGVVLNFEGNGPHARIQVNFERQGTKWLMLSYANLEVV